MPDPLLATCVAELVEDHGCHTVILYGSHARGDATPASDYDLAGLAAVPAGYRVAHHRHGAYFDGFVYPEEVAVDLTMLKLRGGRVLVQRDGAGDRLLAAVEARYQAGPAPWPLDERRAVHAWIEKALARIARGDLEGNYRRIELLYMLLEDEFLARGAWYLGPKASFAWLAANDPETLAAFEAALVPGADHAAIAALARRVRDRIKIEG